MAIEMHQLRYFVAAADAGSVTRAAERCRVAQPSLSQQIKKLEEHLGMTLFDRLGRGIALTDAGRTLLPRARRILADVRDIDANLQRHVAEGAGALAVGAIPTMAPYVLPRAVSDLQRSLPACAISIREGLTEQLVEGLLDNDLDCALLSTPLEHDLLAVEVIAEEELLVVAPRSHVLAVSGATPFHRLKGVATVSLEEMHCLGRQIQGFCGAQQVASRIVCRASQLSTIFDLVSLGLGISIVPEMAASAETRPNLAFVRLTPNPLVRQIAVAWRRDRSRTRAAVQFVEHVRGNFARGVHQLTRERVRQRLRRDRAMRQSPTPQR